MNAQLRFFWIAEYNNGECLPQFDFITGEENLFKEVDQDKLIRFSWYPFTFDLSQKVPDSIVNPLFGKFTLQVRPDDKLFARRRNYLQQGTDIRFTQYLLGNQDFIMIIDENGNCEITYDRDN